MRIHLLHSGLLTGLLTGLLSGLFACNGDKAADSGAPDATTATATGTSGATGGSTTGGTADCEITVDSTWPEDGATDAYYRDAISFHLSAADPTAQVSADFAGTQTTTDDGATIIFTPDAPLEPSTAYTVTLDYCYGAPSISFTTSSLGESITDMGALNGAIFELDTSSVHWVSSEGVGGVLAGLLNRPILMQIQGYDGKNASALLAIAESGSDRQDFCYRSYQVDGLDLSALPLMTYSVAETSFSFYKDDLSCYDINIEGTIASDVSGIGGFELSLLVDLGGMLEALGSADIAAACDFVASLGAECEPCPRGGTMSCIQLAADRISMPEIGGRDLELIDKRDTDPRCEKVKQKGP